jgi:hypothetical protein
MGTQQVRLAEVRHGRRPSGLRLLAPLRYLAIHHPEKTKYDFLVPGVVGVCAWGLYMLISPRMPLFGEAGLLKFTRDLLVMAVPFMVGALASVAMGSPGNHMDRRPIGAELWLDGEALTLRQFVCYLLGYLCFVALVVLISAVAAELLKNSVLTWIKNAPGLRVPVHAAGAFVLSILLSALTVTVFWSLYFLTDTVNRKVP